MNEKKRIILNVPYIDQSIHYPTGCESVSSVMLLQYLGIDITVDEFIEKYLDRQEFEERDGELFGPDPREYFCGSPYDADSFGCYAPVIVNALEKIFSENRENISCKTAAGMYRAVDETGTPLDRLINKYVDREMPVICWACIDMREPVTGPQWRLRGTGELFTWISNEHCMLLVGYDRENYYFNDPHNGNGVIGYKKEIVEERHRAQYMQAVGVRNEQTEE